MSNNLISSMFTSLLGPLQEILCVQIRLSMYYKKNDYISIDDIYSLLSQCTNNPNQMLSYLIEHNILRPTDKPNVLQVV